MIYECFDGQKNKCMKEHGYLPDFIQDQIYFPNKDFRKLIEK